MPSISLLNGQGQPSGSLDLSDSVFARRGDTGVVHQAMVQELANRRQGTVSTKGRGDVRGGGRKPWRQKGTGRARHGSIRSPIWVHGGSAHGPHPRDHRIEMPRKQKRVAMMRALSARLADGDLSAVESIGLDEPKTRQMVAYLRGLGIDELATRLLVVVGDTDASAVRRASANLRRTRVCVAPSIALVDVLWADRILCTSEALKRLEETLGR